MPNRTRNRPFSVRLTEAEYAVWLKKQKASGLGKTDYFISLLKNSVIKVFSFSQEVEILYGELRKIGVNLNQIAYYTNSGFTRQAEQLITEMTTTYGAVMLQLKRFLERPLINATIVETYEVSEVE